MRKRRNTIFTPPPLRAGASKLHKGVLKLVHGLFPDYSVLEEQSIEANDRGRDCFLPVDIVIKELRVAIECQGEQHFQFNTKFHHTVDEFHAQQARDRAKAEALSLAGWTLVAIPHHELADLTASKLSKIILQSIRKQS